MIDDGTVAMPTQTVTVIRYITILTLQGLEDEITGRKSLGSGSQNLRKGLKLFKTRVLNVSLQSSLSTRVIHEKPRVRGNAGRAQ